HRQSQMLWPLTRRRHVSNAQLAQRVSEVRQQNPESERWLGLVEAAFAEADEYQAWADTVRTVANERSIRVVQVDQSQIAVRWRSSGGSSGSGGGAVAAAPPAGKCPGSAVLSATKRTTRTSAISPPRRGRRRVRSRSATPARAT